MCIHNHQAGYTNMNQTDNTDFFLANYLNYVKKRFMNAA